MYENREVVCPPILCSEEELFKYLGEDKKHWRKTHAILNEVLACFPPEQWVEASLEKIEKLHTDTNHGDGLKDGNVEEHNGDGESLEGRSECNGGRDGATSS